MAKERETGSSSAMVPVKRKGVRFRSGQNSKPAQLTIRQAFEVFYQAKAGQRLRELTLRDHRQHFEYLMEWLTEAHPEIQYISEITSQTIREYVHYLSFEKPLYEGHPYLEKVMEGRKGLAPGAVNVRIATLKTMFRWLANEGIIATNPTQNLSRQKVDEDRIGAFTDEQVEALLAQPDRRTYAGFRDYVAMELLLQSGMRLGELISLEVSDIDFGTRLITLKGAKNKNRKVRVIPIAPEMMRLLIELINENKTYFPDATRVFLTNYGGPLSNFSVKNHIKQYGQRAGIANQVRCSPHTFRHTFAKNFLMAGADIIALQRILGHSSMEMVRKYVQHRPEDLREAHDLFSRRQVTIRRRK
ncbi:tyrosine-type recombinase/integrase [Alicyclobacillus cycloheptanicus]|uniref:Integrase/recombinase XerD n=1 Tax=Alicyclobacillus cycloheptanicus TaxID=1457 RepID=A0ABT9XG29_9BACL|nr:tyrosine-type recombinase/integrase [Alicyclobacillus cycloheptanicus]MDQ0189248.1 integrase/recombinase XerD [Alicyclobacillus cycloheptanicus]WDM00431.1 tyrosine-type recombinase/integrase [Alicyclobacillus cycloheptanicus]